MAPTKEQLIAEIATARKNRDAFRRLSKLTGKDPRTIAFQKSAAEWFNEELKKLKSEMKLLFGEE